MLSLRAGQEGFLLRASHAAMLAFILHLPSPPTFPILSRCAGPYFVSSSFAPAGLLGTCLKFSWCGAGFSGSTPARCLPWAPLLSNHMILQTVLMASCCSFVGTCRGREWVFGIMRENQALKTQDDPYFIFLFVNGKTEIHTACWGTHTLWCLVPMPHRRTTCWHLLSLSICSSLWVHYGTVPTMLQIKLPEPFGDWRLGTV